MHKACNHMDVNKQIQTGHIGCSFQQEMSYEKMFLKLFNELSHT